MQPSSIEDACTVARRLRRKTVLSARQNRPSFEKPKGAALCKKFPADFFPDEFSGIPSPEGTATKCPRKLTLDRLPNTQLLKIKSQSIFQTARTTTTSMVEQKKQNTSSKNNMCSNILANCSNIIMTTSQQMSRIQTIPSLRQLKRIHTNLQTQISAPKEQSDSNKQNRPELSNRTVMARRPLRKLRIMATEAQENMATPETQADTPTFLSSHHSSRIKQIREWNCQLEPPIKKSVARNDDNIFRKKSLSACLNVIMEQGNMPKGAIKVERAGRISRPKLPELFTGRCSSFKEVKAPKVRTTEAAKISLEKDYLQDTFRVRKLL